MYDSRLTSSHALQRQKILKNQFAPINEASLYCSRLRLSQSHTNPKRQRGNDLAPSLAIRVSNSRNRERYSTTFKLSKNNHVAHRERSQSLSNNTCENAKPTTRSAELGCKRNRRKNFRFFEPAQSRGVSADTLGILGRTNP